MNYLFGFAVFFIIWWLSLLVILPIGVRTQADEGKGVVPGTDAGAPVRHRLGLKLIANTVFVAIVFAVWYWLSHKMGWTLQSLPSFFPQDR